MNKGKFRSPQLEARLRYVETAAAEVCGRHDELYQTTAQVQAADRNAATHAREMHAHAQQDARMACRLLAEMRHAEQATGLLRDNFAYLEGQAELGTEERAALQDRRAALDQESAQMRAGVYAQEQQLALVKQTLVQNESRNAAESRELAAMFQECRALPARLPHLLSHDPLQAPCPVRL